MTIAFNKNTLKQERDDAFYKWFEKWRTEKDFENCILKSNKKGFTAFEHYLRYEDSKNQQRFKHKDFLKSCQDKMSGIDVAIIDKKSNSFLVSYEKVLIFDWTMDKKRLW